MNKERQKSLEIYYQGLLPDCHPWVIQLLAEDGEKELTKLDEVNSKLGEFAEKLKEQESQISNLQEVAGWAQALLTALNIGDVKSGSPLHWKLREVMISYREKCSKS